MKIISAFLTSLVFKTIVGKTLLTDTFLEVPVLWGRAFEVAKTVNGVGSPANCAVHCQLANCSVFTTEQGRCLLLVVKENPIMLDAPDIGESVFTRTKLEFRSRLFLQCTNTSFYFDIDLERGDGSGASWIPFFTGAIYMGLHKNGFVLCHLENAECKFLKIGGSNWETSPQDPPTSRVGMAVTYFNNTTVLVSGGLDPTATSSDLWEAGVWTPGPDLPAPFSGHTGIALDENRVLLVGGDAAGPITGSSWEYSWISAAWIQRGSLITPRADHGGAKFTDQAGVTRILICGGRPDATTILTSCESYNDTTHQWTLESSIKLVQGRLNAHWIVHKSRVYVIGGRLDTVDEMSNLIETFDGNNFQWFSASTCSFALPYIIYNIEH